MYVPGMYVPGRNVGGEEVQMLNAKMLNQRLARIKGLYFEKLKIRIYRRVVSVCRLTTGSGVQVQSSESAMQHKKLKVPVVPTSENQVANTQRSSTYNHRPPTTYR